MLLWCGGTADLTAGTATLPLPQHLGSRTAYLPGSVGFDYYLGIPYSADMGDARATPCAEKDDSVRVVRGATEQWLQQQMTSGVSSVEVLHASQGTSSGRPSAVTAPDPASKYLPLVYQRPLSTGNDDEPTNQYSRGSTLRRRTNTTVLEQPLDFSTLGPKYNDFALEFIEDHAAAPFFLYFPFSHVHATSGIQPQEQYASCAFQNSTQRGLFGDALAEVDWIVGNIVEKLEALKLQSNTLILFTGDNGPDMFKGQSGGSEGLFTGRYSGYWNTGKGSTWEGGVRYVAV